MHHAGPAVNDLLGRLLAELRAEGLPDPLSQPLALWASGSDLCRLAGETAWPAA